MQFYPPFFKIFFITNRCYILFLLPLVLLFSCADPDSDKDGIIDSKDKCPDVYAKTKDGCPPPEKQLGHIHFYIDNSASMGGYFKKDAAFNEIISDLTAKIDKEIKPVDIAFMAETIVPYSKPVQQFSEDIARTQPASQRSSQLHTMIEKMADRNDSNDVSLLVSDCILSFPDDAIKANPEINKEKAASTLKTNIYQSFEDLKKQGVATSVYAFTSKFYGTYYDYHNHKKTLNGESRPFYVWVIANKELLPKFSAQLADISSFRPEQSLSFGLAGEPVQQYDILSQIEKKGDWLWNKSDQAISGINSKETDQQFCVALNLDKLPPYARATDYLKQHLQVKNTGCEVAVEAVMEKANADASKLKSNSQKKIFEEATHLIVFKINALSLPQATTEISLPLQYDNWYMDWSTMDDTAADAMKNKTFALQYLVAGVREAYDTKNKNFIEFTVHLKR